MSELTNETLRAINKNLEEYLGLFSESEMGRNQKTYCTFRPSELHNMEESINELLAIREAGDEEVEKLREDAGCKEFHEDRIEALDKLRDIAIARGKTRTDAVNKAAEWAKECEALQEEIERLKRENETIKGYFPKGAFETNPQHEDGNGGYYDLFPGGIYQ